MGKACESHWQSSENPAQEKCYTQARGFSPIHARVSPVGGACVCAGVRALACAYVCVRVWACACASYPARARVCVCYPWESIGKRRESGVLSVRLRERRGCALCLPFLLTLYAHALHLSAYGYLMAIHLLPYGIYDALCYSLAIQC